jgi:hypothetical protein
MTLHRDASTAIHVLAMSHPDHRDQQLDTVEGIDDAVLSHPQAAKASPLGVQDCALEWISAQGFDRFDHSTAALLGKGRGLANRSPIPADANLTRL